MKRVDVRRWTIAGAVAAAGALGTIGAASADPVGQMTPNGAAISYLPSQFANSPTTTGPQGDVAALTFDDRGQFIRAGRPDGPQASYDVSPSSGPAIRQARAIDPADQNRAVETVYSRFRESLRRLSR